MDAWKRHSAPFSKGDGDTGAEVMNRDEMKTLWDLSPLRTVTLSLADGSNIPWDAIVGCDHTNLVVQINNESQRIPWEDLDPWTRMIFGTDNHRGMDQAPITQNETTTPNPETPEATTTEDPVDLEKLLATIPEKILTAIRENAATQYPDSHSNQLTIVQQEASAYNWIHSTKQSAAKERNTLMLDTILKANTAHPGAFNTQKNFIEKEYDAALAIGVTPDKYQPENNESENLILEAMDMPEECIAAMRRRAELAGPRRGQELIATETAAWGAILEIRSTATAEQIEIIDRVVNRFARTADFDMALRHIQTQLGLR
jgi:hypothetical protein